MIDRPVGETYRLRPKDKTPLVITAQSRSNATAGFRHALRIKKAAKRRAELERARAKEI